MAVNVFGQLVKILIQVLQRALNLPELTHHILHEKPVRIFKKRMVYGFRGVSEGVSEGV